ncbi:hypothetical protein ACFODZ_00665 [Marinicella sediminis]|uniref:Uncharacterized protein n=1 Tax=Marinicella sediminis TaxID=1792834 RepID=A0ABV7J3P1_9GAMM|nr:hypothetical protein [Marinicella sediminis]
MSFRQDNKDPERQWLSHNKGLLNELGVPDAAIEHWNYVLLHGDDAFGSGWHAENLSIEDAKALLALLKSFYKNETGLDLIQVLRRVIARTEKSGV